MGILYVTTFFRDFVSFPYLNTLTTAMVALRYASALNRLSSLRRVRGLATIHPQTSLFAPLDSFPERHIGPDDHESSLMLSKLGYSSMDAFIQETVPPKIRISSASVNNTSIPALSESELYARAKALGAQNKSFKSYIGMGYHAAVVPPVILRNVSFLFHQCHCHINLVGSQVMENPAWYTPYTPYQPEIAQG